MRRRIDHSKFDEKKWKPVIVGMIVFVIVFIGLTAYQQSSGKAQGDMIVTNGEDIIDETTSMPESELLAGDSVNDEPSVIFVDVGGAVQISGLFALPAGSRVDNAIDAAGGLAENAEMKFINRAYVLADGDRLYIPTVTEVNDGTAPPTAGQVTAYGGSGAGSSPGTSHDSSGNMLININTANSDELQRLNGVGPATAQKIIDYRTKSGGFKLIEDIMNVNGIGAKTFEKLRAYITV